MTNTECKTIDDVLASQGVKSTKDLNGNMSIGTLKANKIKTKGLKSDIKDKAYTHNLFIQYLVASKRLHNSRIRQYKSNIKSIVGATDYKSISNYLDKSSNQTSNVDYKTKYDKLKQTSDATYKQLNKDDNKITSLKNKISNLSGKLNRVDDILPNQQQQPNNYNNN